MFENLHYHLQRILKLWYGNQLDDFQLLLDVRGVVQGGDFELGVLKVIEGLIVLGEHLVVVGCRGLLLEAFLQYALDGAFINFGLFEDHSNYYQKSS